MILENEIKQIKETYQTLEKLRERVCSAEMNALAENADILELHIPLKTVKTYFGDVVSTLENPEVGKKYNILRPFKRARALRATKAAKAALNNLPSDYISDISEAAQKALNGDLEDIADEGAEPVTKVREVLKLYSSLRRVQNARNRPDRVVGRGHHVLVSVLTGCAALVGYLKAFDTYVTTLQTELSKAPDFTSQICRAAEETAKRAASGDLYMGIFFSLINAFAIHNYVRSRKLN